MNEPVAIIGLSMKNARPPYSRRNVIVLVDLTGGRGPLHTPINSHVDITLPDEPARAKRWPTLCVH